MLNETKRYEYMLYTGEGKRVHRVLGGTELARAEHKAHSIRMGAMGISTTNLVFDSDLLPDLDPEIIKILKTDPTHDENIMYPRCPVTPQTSSVTKSSRSGDKPLEPYDYEAVTYWDSGTLDQLDKPRSATMSIINNLPYWIHDLERWKNGFNPVKYRRSIHQLKKAHLTAVHGADRVNRAGEVITRKLRIKRRVPRVQTQSIRY